MTANIIPFDFHSRRLAKAKILLCSPDEAFADAEHAISVLCGALPYADEPLRLKIVLMLGSLGRPQVVWPLYKVMHDADQDETIRHAAAIQLSVLGAMIEPLDALGSRLKDDLKHPDPCIRANAAFALGWEGNSQAAESLKTCLNDEDLEVQQAAVNALATIGNETAFIFLVENLSTGTREQRKNILYNLYRFSSKKNEVIALYRSFISGPDTQLRYDALVMYNAVVGVDEAVADYLQCLSDKQDCVREIALTRLMAADVKKLTGITYHLEPLLHDSDDRVKQAAIKLYNRVQKHPL